MVEVQEAEIRAMNDMNERQKVHGSELCAERGYRYRVVIALIAKGSMNNLHRQDIVDKFREKSVDVSFLVREDYLALVKSIEGCRYLTCRFPEEVGQRGFWRRLLRYVRSLYPVGAVGRRETVTREVSFKKRISKAVFGMIARYHAPMRWISRLECYFYRDEVINDLDPNAMDQLLLLGVGAHGSEHESKLTWWARQHGISVVHMIGNWDTFTSKGYPGAPVNTLLVWGMVMRDDAIVLHDVPETSIKVIGSIKYDGLKETVREHREAFLRRCGLDPAKKTILFAGPLSEDQYFEILRVYETIREEDGGYQMIFRVYPDKGFMASVYVKPLIHYARSLPGVYVSIGDPDYRIGRKDQAVLHVEQHELWNSLQHCDVVVNFYSTIALESCLFDKPVISMVYRPMKNYTWIHPPEYADHGVLPHNRRLVDYGAVKRVFSRKELIEAIDDAAKEPVRYSANRKHAVDQELGWLDGGVCERLVKACIDAYAADSAKTSRVRVGKGMAVS